MYCKIKIHKPAFFFEGNKYKNKSRKPRIEDM